MSALINTLLATKSNFALCRTPHEDKAKLFTSNKLSYIKNLYEINNKKGFLISPFDFNKYKIILFENPNIQYIPIIKQPEYPFLEPQKENINSRYSETYNLFIDKIKTGIFEKLVLSWKEEIKITKKPNPLELFYKSVQTYPDSFNFMFYTPESGLWLGNSPEILLSGTKDKMYTVALAGTMKATENHWTEKNKKEQKFVVEYIKNSLNKLNIQPQEESTISIKTGSIQHLKTLLNFKLRQQSLGEIIQNLYPTPAICGLPKQESFNFITNNEVFDRSYYSGLVGMLDIDNRSDIYVNLRSMQIEDNNFNLYAGGGLVESSNLMEEWDEICQKLFTTKRLIENV